MFWSLITNFKVIDFRTRASKKFPKLCPQYLFKPQFIGLQWVTVLRGACQQGGFLHTFGTCPLLSLLGDWQRLAGCQQFCLDSILPACQPVPTATLSFTLLSWFFCLLPKLPPSSFCQLSTFISFSHTASTFPGPQHANKSLHCPRDTCEVLSLVGWGQLLH